MARHAFGGGIADYTLAYGDTVTIGGQAGKPAIAVGGVEIQFFNAEVGGDRHLDLLDPDGSPATVIVSADGSGVRSLGQIPPFQGPDVEAPDEVTEMWASAGGGPRVRMVAVLGAQVKMAERRSAEVRGGLAAHVAQVNAHDTGVGDLADVQVPSADNRPVGQVLGVVAGGGFELLSPAQVSGAVMLDPPPVAGEYVGNVASPPDPSQGSSGRPWLRIQQPHSASDDNPDLYQYGSTTAGGAWIKTNWAGGNGEWRGAPSTKGRVAARVFEFYESLGGPSTGRFFELSTNPSNSANREALLGAYGTGHASKPGWIEVTRVLSGLLGVRAGGNYNGLSAATFRGLSGDAGTPTTGTWSTGDVIVDTVGVVWRCTASGSPGTWVGVTPQGTPELPAPTAFADVTPGANVGHGAKHAATRLEHDGHVARLRGSLVASGAVANGATIATIDTAEHRPAVDAVTIARYTGGGARLAVTAAGAITIGATMSAGQEVWLDSITWDLEA